MCLEIAAGGGGGGEGIYFSLQKTLFTSSRGQGFGWALLGYVSMPLCAFFGRRDPCCSLARSPNSVLLPFLFWGRLPLKSTTEKKKKKKKKKN